MLEKFKQELEVKQVVYLRIKARPGAASTEVKGILESDDGETIKIDVAAVPEQGKANAELVKYLAKVFEVLKGQIEVVSGAGDKIKLIRISK